MFFQHITEIHTARFKKWDLLFELDQAFSVAEKKATFELAGNSRGREKNCATGKQKIKENEGRLSFELFCRPITAEQKKWKLRLFWSLVFLANTVIREKGGQKNHAIGNMNGEKSFKMGKTLQIR